ncbi:hypothetical protein [Paraburkholderia sp.]|uniref:hypothetical protein n=1 Tax=Paraburkholderia sp. TaxID=1926495 RepID=UPI0023A32EC3|nr:hypothetical protein [Paraburkholderia sp.]MDE1180642.1 hypothetical protein [Paraburkholderia sp.]
MTTRSFDVIERCALRGIGYEHLHDDVRSGMKNADPAVWPVLEAVGRVYRAHRRELDAHGDATGVIQSGSAFPKATAQRVIADIARSGRVSPVAFINANAGAALSICCTRFGLRGPTLNLTMPSTRARAMVDALAARWLAQRDAQYLFLIEADDAPDAAIDADIAVTVRLIHATGAHLPLSTAITGVHHHDV